MRSCARSNSYAIGVKIFGKDRGEIERLAKAIESFARNVPGTTSAYAERVTGGYCVAE